MYIIYTFDFSSCAVFYVYLMKRGCAVKQERVIIEIYPILSILSLYFNIVTIKVSFIYSFVNGFVFVELALISLDHLFALGQIHNRVNGVHVGCSPVEK